MLEDDDAPEYCLRSSDYAAWNRMKAQRVEGRRKVVLAGGFAVVMALVIGAFLLVMLGTRPAEAEPMRNFERFGPYASDRPNAPAGANSAEHQGRAAGTFEDNGLGGISFDVKAGQDGTATVRFQDVGDTGNFKSFAVNGDTIDIPAPARNGGILTVLLEFGRAGWHKVTAVTTLRSGLPSNRQDGFSVCRK